MLFTQPYTDTHPRIEKVLVWCGIAPSRGWNRTQSINQGEVHPIFFRHNTVTRTHTERESVRQREREREVFFQGHAAESHNEGWML